MEATVRLVKSFYIVCLTLVLGFLIPSTVQAQAPSFSQQTQLLGRPLVVTGKSQATQNPSDSSGSTQTLSQDLSLQLLGHQKSLMSVQLQSGPAPSPSIAPSSSPSPSPSPVQPAGVVLNQSDFYVGGVRIWTGKLNYANGALNYAGGVAPTQVSVPILAYPLGPILLEVAAGVDFEGLVQAKLLPGLSYPLPDSTLEASLLANVYVSGFVDAYAQLLFLRGGVAGQIDVINAQEGFKSVFSMTAGIRPQISSVGYASLLSGRVYGFVDMNVLFGWKHILRKDFFNWPGKCISFTPGVKKCGP